MRLHRLELEGVGSFADHMRVDFEGLTNAGLFLIEGPTGSGKSTILDAIVFALYGSVAGSGSDLGRLDSHLRTRSPWVELEFQVADVVYRVRRSPAHQRAKKRGEGMTSVNTTASLMQVTPDGPIELATRASEVAEHIHAIIGLSKQQFVSTVVLAQGEFATFLDAGTGDRTQILERIFGTEFYQHVEDQLHQMRRQARMRRSDAADAVGEIVEQCKGILDVEFDEAEPLAHVDAAMNAVRSELTDAQRSAESADAERERRERALQAAQRLAADQDRKRTAVDRAAALAARREQVEHWQSAVRAHHRTTPLVPAISAWRQSVEAAGVAERALTACCDVLVDLGESAQPDLGRHQQVVGLLGSLQHAVRLEDDLTTLRSRVEFLRGEASRADVAVRQTQEALRLVGIETAQVTADLRDCPDVSERILALTRTVEDLGQKSGRWSRLGGIREQLVSAQKAAASAHTRWAVANDHLRSAQEALLRDHAARLADGLVDGQPCSVCGSSAHPAPAQRSATPVADLDSLREVAEQCRTAAVASDQTVNRLTGVIEELLTQCAGSDEVQVHEQLLEAADALDATHERQSRRLGLVSRLQELAADRQATTEDLAQVQVSQQRCTSEFESAATSLDAAQVAVAEARAEYPSVAVRVAALTKVRDAQAAAIDAAATAGSRTDEVARAGAVVEQSLRSAGFSDVDAAERNVLPEDELVRCQAEIDHWEAQWAHVGAILRELETVDLTTAPDVSTLEARAVEAGAVAKMADRRVVTLTDRIARAAPRREELRVRADHLDTVRSETEPVIRMADLATAQRHEVIHRVRLSSFVLMRRFEEVIYAANDRLDAISDGRYQLVVVGSGLDARSQAGLDLDVYDGRSDSRRSTKSLSGGERFYVSLALALGLADVVRAESGGVELGTLFIDEGFGSLDAEVLEEVMDMLEQVRVGEDRVIGLISHVEVMKSRIDPRISVRRDPTRPGVSTLEVHA